MKIRLSTTHSDGSLIAYSASVVATDIKTRGLWVRIPDRVRALRFPPFNGKRFALITAEYAKRWLTAEAF